MYQFFWTPFVWLNIFLCHAHARLTRATFSRPFRILCRINPAFSSLVNQTYQIRNRHRKREFNDQLIYIVSNS